MHSEKPLLALAVILFIGSVFYAAERLTGDPEPPTKLPVSFRAPASVSSPSMQRVTVEQGAHSLTPRFNTERLATPQVPREAFVEQDDGGMYLVKAPAVSKPIKSTLELGQLLGWAAWCVRQELDSSSPTVPVCDYMIEMLPQWLDMMDARAKRSDAADAIAAQTWLDKINATMKYPPPRAADDAMVEGALALWWAQPGSR